MKEKERVREGGRAVRNKGGRNNVARDLVFLPRVSGVKMQEPFPDYALLGIVLSSIDCPGTALETVSGYVIFEFAEWNKERGTLSCV